LWLRLEAFGNDLVWCLSVENALPPGIVDSEAFWATTHRVRTEPIGNIMPLQQTLSMQLYSSRFSGSLGEQLRAIAAAGYTNVEPYDALYADPRALRGCLDSNELSCLSGHFDMRFLESDPQQVLKIARQLGIKLVVAPWLEPEDRPNDACGWSQFAERLGAVQTWLRDAGLKFAWHNNDFEFQRLSDGTYPIEILLDNDALCFELDLAWIARVGEDPVAWLRRFKGRVAAIHVKDVASMDNSFSEDGWADVGEGILSWTSLWPQAIAAGARLAVVEHDAPTDFLRFAQRSWLAIRRFRGSD
jgi:sugar phosphate isomerase/epimerase